MSEHADLAGILLSLRGVWDEVAVDELDHALQSAARAMDDGADDELVLAAALHDIAHSPLMPAGLAHDLLAREWLTPRYGERVSWLAGAHEAAKRYLAATVPGYQLSATSERSLQHQGGAAVDTAFVDHPWWPDALRLRHYDDAAKDPGAAGATVEQVLEVARRVRIAHDLDPDGTR